MIPLTGYLMKGLINFRMSYIYSALLVATVSELAKDSALMGISLEIQVFVFLPLRKSKMPHSYSCFDLVSRLRVR